MYRCEYFSSLVLTLCKEFPILSRNDALYILDNSGYANTQTNEYYISDKEYDKVIDLIYQFASIDKDYVITKEVIIEIMSRFLRPVPALSYEQIKEDIISSYIEY